MKARDVMTARVVTVQPDADVLTIANLMVGNGISAVPVLDGQRLVGIVSEGDLIHRVETHTERRRSWWLELFTSDRARAVDFVKSHGRKAKEIMTSNVVTASPDASLYDIASLLEKHHVKRIPIVEQDRLVGIVSRANLVQVLASAPADISTHVDDSRLRNEILKRIEGQPWADRPFNVLVRNGNVSLNGFVFNDDERSAIGVAAEITPGIAGVANNLRVVTRPAGF